jgi:hypothetical protein
MAVSAAALALRRELISYVDEAAFLAALDRAISLHPSPGY